MLIGFGAPVAWSDVVSSFSGEFYTVPAGRQDPRPVQRLSGGCAACS